MATRTLILALAVAASAGAPAQDVVANGIDVLRAEQFARLRGKRIGLITNHTGRALDGHSTVELLHAAPDVELVALFCPEHGFEGKLDALVPDARDARTGLAIHSLYGSTRKPTPESLAGLDLLLFDIQDVGCRFYTYISTMGLAQEAAAEAGIPFVVLDRPNPLGGEIVEGPLRDADAASFTAWHPLPIRHGMTIGELARMFAAERRLGGASVVVAMRGWRRAMPFDATGQVWIDPSPNMRSVTQALLYPGIGLVEFTNLSVGRGTDAPFEQIGAPWLDHRRLAASLNAAAIPGLRCVPIEFTPAASRFAGESCRGVRFVVTDRAEFRPVQAGLALAGLLREQPDWDFAPYAKLLAHDATFAGLGKRENWRALHAGFATDVERFLARREPFLLYR